MSTHKLATRHHCINSISVHCTRGNGRPTRKSCKFCGSLLVSEQGRWGVFAWRGDGRYRADEAVSLHSSEPRAEAARSGELVVRWIFESMPQEVTA